MMFCHADMAFSTQVIAQLQFLVDSLIELQTSRSTGLVPELMANRKSASIPLERGPQLHDQRGK